MPPVTPRAMSAMSLLRIRRQFLDLALANFFLRKPHELFAAGGPWRAAAQQLLGASASQHHEFKRIWHVSSVDHTESFRKNVSTICSACSRTARCRDRSASTMAASLATQL